SLGTVETIDENLVQAEVGGEGELVGGVEINRVRVRLRLSRLDDARTLMLHRGGCGAEFAVGINGERGDAAAAVIGHEHVLSFLIDGDETRAGPLRRLLIEERQLRGLR